MKKIICLILVLASLFSFSSCGKKQQQERNAIVLGVVKDAVWLVEAIAGVTIKEVSGVSLNYNDDKEIRSAYITFRDMNNVHHCIDGDFLDRRDDECTPLNTAYFSCYRIKGASIETQDVDLEWINSELQNYRNMPNAKLDSAERFHLQCSAWVDCVQENHLVSVGSDGINDKALPTTAVAHLKYVHKFLESLTAAERDEMHTYKNDPLYRYASIIAREEAIQCIKNDVVNPNSLQVHSQTVTTYKTAKGVYCHEVVTDCSAQNRMGGYERESITKYIYSGDLDDIENSYVNGVETDYYAEIYNAQEVCVEYYD